MVLITGKQIQSVPAAKVETNSQNLFVTQQEKDKWNRKIIRKGVSNFVPINGVVIRMSEPMPNTNYHVSITPLENTNGGLGEVFVSELTTSSFRVTATGRTENRFSWLAVTEE